MADATIILAGGVGSRLWPASLRANPKQLLRPGGGRSLIQRAISLALAATPAGPVVIVTNRDHVAGIEGHVAELEAEEPGLSRRIVYLPEPVGRNTAPAVALGMVYLKSILDPSAAVLVLSADHVITPADRFVADSEAAAELAASGDLVCFGIKPTRPETGYGYIHSGDVRLGGFRVESFTEKPDRTTAERYLSQGGYFWNAGIFCFTPGGFMNELAAHAPDIAAPFESLGPSLSLARTSAGSLCADPEGLESLYAALPKISIDYALMERTTRVALVPATFTWSDVGSWDEVATLGPGQQQLIEVDSGGNYVDSDLPVAICGISDIHVVVKNGKVLVCRRGESQMVKEVVASAEADRKGEFL